MLPIINWLYLVNTEISDPSSATWSLAGTKHQTHRLIILRRIIYIYQKKKNNILETYAYGVICSTFYLNITCMKPSEIHFTSSRPNTIHTY